MIIQDNTIVSAAFEFKLEDGQLISSSQENSLMVYLHGYQTILPAIESALNGKKTGDQLTLSLSPDQAYGEHRAELVFESRREYLPQDQELKPGLVFYTGHGDRQPFALKIVELTDEGAIVDGNHPLAGKTLLIDLTVQSVRQATDEEIEIKQPLTK